MKKLTKRKLLFERKIILSGYFIMFFLFMISIFYFVIFPVMKFNPKIYYKNLDSFQTAEANYLLDNLKPEYLDLARSITFVNNSQDLKESSFFSSFQVNDNALGYFNNKKIYMIVSGDIEYDKLVLCHELLHSILPVGNEEYVYDLMMYDPCYKEMIE